jgi:hypothetical protein
MTSNRLTILAVEINRAHTAAQEAVKVSVERAIEAGHALIEAKSLVKHGDWLPFLKEAGTPERTAQRYIALANSGLKSDTVSDLGGIRAALDHLAAEARIRSELDNLWSLLLEAHDRKAWHALGYPTWRDYVQAELPDMDILDREQIIQAIEAAGGAATEPQGDGALSAGGFNTCHE